MTITLSSPELVVEIEPERGGEISQIRARDVPLLFAWEPRDGGGDDSASRWLRRYRGGWQTIFPNGGEESEGHGFHGEACLVPYEHSVSGQSVELRAAVGDFEIVRRVSVAAGSVEVVERIIARATAEAMWSHHPAFGAPFIDASCVIESDAAEFVADDERDTIAGDLEPGARAPWPHARARDGSLADLRAVPDGGDRFGYLTEVSRATITNPSLGLRVTLEWEPLRSAWYWLEANATEDFPWFGDAYVFAIEPASTWPGQGIAKARAKGGPLVRFEAGETKEARVVLTVSRL